MAGKLDDAALDAHKQRVKILRIIARVWEGTDKDYAAQLRAGARMMAKDPDFANMEKQHAHYTEIKNAVTAATEAFHEKQVRAQNSSKRVVTKPWYADADKIISCI
jgi:crotonobetainyl-CoA:carnitine CoA-transferase CaiB-like acyl-CoA transferase